MSPEEPKKKYLVCGGRVTSKTDRQSHYISPGKLMQLYGLNPRECFCVTNENDPAIRTLPQGLQILKPRYDGNYKLVREDTTK